MNKTGNDTESKPLTVAHSGKWKPGFCPNPSGRKRGTKNKKTLERERLAMNDTEAIKETITKFLRENLGDILQEVADFDPNHRTSEGKFSKLSRTKIELVSFVLPYVLPRLASSDSRIDLSKLSGDELNAVLEKVLTDDKKQSA